MFHLPTEDTTTNAREHRREARREERRHTFAPVAPPPGVKTAKRAQSATIDTGSTFHLPLRIKPNGQWGYKFGSLRRAIRSGRLVAE